jgi:hypothetical protein
MKTGVTVEKTNRKWSDVVGENWNETDADLSYCQECGHNTPHDLYPDHDLQVIKGYCGVCDHCSIIVFEG